jgi:hypothetical protein
MAKKRDKYIGVMEFENKNGEWDNWTIIKRGPVYLIGTPTNTGLLSTYFYKPERGETEQTSLEEINSDLEVLAQDGERAMSKVKRIAKNNPAYKKSWGGYRGQLHENPARGFKTTKVETAGGVTWEWLNNLLGQKTAKRIAANTEAVRQADGSIAIILYSTKILIYKYSGEGASKPGEIELRLGGWNTATTRNRINALLPYGWRIFTKKGIPYVSNSYKSVEVPPSDKITLNQTGAYV